MQIPNDLEQAMAIIAEEMQELCEQASLGRVSTNLHMTQMQRLQQQIEQAFADVRPLKPSERKGR